ncbi:SDR family NAD(P)-dependent oxidoreductase [Oleiharenicola lentus]|uniref:SDR family NAD(P)-dependent oxidoreductase n=1 Tax=Oleiharenicola lentus TaxID=2508720 RepID=UPI003F66CAE8
MTSQSNEFQDRVIVVTGSSSGFGKGAALAFGAKGASVVLAARRTSLLEGAASEIKASGGDALVVTTDVADAEQIRYLAEQTVARFGRIDIWVNNAGVGVIGPFENAPAEDYSRLIDINLKGVVFGSLSAMQRFRIQGAGTLINVGSIDSEVPLAYQAAYSATKAGVLSLGRALNEEIRLSGQEKIKVATVMPWAIDTPWWGHAANYSGGTPRMGAMDDPQKVVDAILEMARDPKEECPVGWKGKGSYASHKLMPGTTERISANLAHHYQIETAPPAPATKGTLFTPMMSGTGIDDGVRERMEREERARKIVQKLPEEK